MGVSKGDCATCRGICVLQGRAGGTAEPLPARTEGSSKGWGEKRTNVSIVIPPSNLSGITTVERSGVKPGLRPGLPEGVFGETEPFAQATAPAERSGAIPQIGADYKKREPKLPDVSQAAVCLRRCRLGFTSSESGSSVAGNLLAVAASCTASRLANSSLARFCSLRSSIRLGLS